MGIFNWLAAASQIPTITANEAAARLANKDACTVLDVREANEWNAGHIPGAVWIPLGQLNKRIRELPQNQDIIVVCRSGNRSAIATKLLMDQGFRAQNLTGGMLNWRGGVV